MALDPTLYPWAHLLKENMTVGNDPGYQTGIYLPLFEERTFTAIDPAVGSLRYYVYDPTRHGMPADRSYPVLFALHGAGNALAGKLAVNYAGMELFASPEYQQKLGGAYIVCPLANEYRGEDGNSRNTWMTPKAPGDLSGYSPTLRRLADALPIPRLKMLLGAESVYTASLLALLREARAGFARPGKTLLAGTSAGGYAAWTLLTAAPEQFDAALLMAPAYLPPDALLTMLEKQGLPLLLCHSQSDEVVPFAWTVEPHLPRYRRMKNVITYLPELVMNRDGSVASNLSGVQMGQHCINNAVQNDLLFEDGTPMCPALPGGVTGWLRQQLQD